MASMPRQSLRVDRGGFRGAPPTIIGHERWLRNIAVALGNAPTSAEVVDALRARAEDDSALVREHVAWALARHAGAAAG